MRNEKAITTLQHYLDIAKLEDHDVEIKELEILVTSVIPAEKMFEAKKGMFVVVHDSIILQMHEDLIGKFITVSNCRYEIQKIREANASEREAKIEEFKSRGYVCGDDKIWGEPKLEEVYCVAKSKADFIRVYAVKPELVNEASTLKEKEYFMYFCDGSLYNDCTTIDDSHPEVSIEKFINLLKQK